MKLINVDIFQIDHDLILGILKTGLTRHLGKLCPFYHEMLEKGVRKFFDIKNTRGYLHSRVVYNECMKMPKLREGYLSSFEAEKVEAILIWASIFHEISKSFLVFNNHIISSKVCEIIFYDEEKTWRDLLVDCIMFQDSKYEIKEDGIIDVRYLTIIDVFRYAHKQALGGGRHEAGDEYIQY